MLLFSGILLCLLPARTGVRSHLPLHCACGGVMLDRNSIVVAYDFVRGEPRKLKSGNPNQAPARCGQYKGEVETATVEAPAGYSAKSLQWQPGGRNEGRIGRLYRPQTHAYRFAYPSISATVPNWNASTVPLVSTPVTR